MSSKAIGPDDKIPCPTVETLLWELEKLEEALEGAEKEETWERFERGILRFAAVTRGGGHKFTEVYIEGMGIKGLGPRVVECMLSDRGRLSGVATDFLTSMAPRLGPNFSSLIPLYIPPTIRLLARPNKVYLRRAEKCLLTIVVHCPLPSLITLIRFGTQDKNEACRRSCGGALERILREWDRELIGNKGLVELEAAMKRMATEKDAEVRKIGKRMWENYAAKWPERIEEFTAPLTPTIKKYLDISQTKSATSRTLFNAPAVRVKHPLSQTTTAEPMARPTLASRHASSSSSVNKDRNLQAIRGLGRAAENGVSQQTVPTVNGMKPFLLRSTSAMVTSSANTGRAGMLRSASAANVFGERHLVEEEEDHGEDIFTSDITPSACTSRPRVLTHASTPELTGASMMRSQAQRGAGGLTTGGAPARRARIVSGLTQVTEGRAGPSSGTIGMGRPQGAVRPTGRVVSSSATIGVGSRNVSGSKASDGRAGHASAIKPKMLVTSVLEQKKASGTSSVSSSTASKVEKEDLPAGEAEEADDANSPVKDSTVKTTTVAKTITTNPGGTVKTRQFFRPTPAGATGQASLHASTTSNTSAASTKENRLLGEQKRAVSRTVGTTRTGGGLTAPTASSGAKVVHRALQDPPKPHSAYNGIPNTRESSMNPQQLQAKLVVSPRKPKPKLKPPVPAFMPVSRNRTVKDGKSASSTLGPGEARARLNAHTRVKVAAVEPASIPLPASPAAKLTQRHTETKLQPASAAEALVMPVVPTVNQDQEIAVAEVPLPQSPQQETMQPLPEDQAAADDFITAELKLPNTDIIEDATPRAASDNSKPVTSSIAHASTVCPVLLTAEESADEGDLSHGSVTFKKKSDQGLRETLARASASRAMANEQNVPPPISAAEVNLIDFSDPDSPQKPSVRPEPTAKRTPLGPASPNQILSVKKAASATPASPKVKQLQDFFEKRAFSPSPSPERLPSSMSSISPRRASTTPTATPPRPRVLG